MLPPFTDIIPYRSMFWCAGGQLRPSQAMETELRRCSDGKRQCGQIWADTQTESWT